MAGDAARARARAQGPAQSGVHLLPSSWPEVSEVHGPQTGNELDRALPFVSRRRSQIAAPDDLLRRALPRPHLPLRTAAAEALPFPCLPNGAPRDRAIRIEELYNAGVYAGEIQPTLDEHAGAVANWMRRDALHTRQCAMLAAGRAEDPWQRKQNTLEARAIAAELALPPWPTPKTRVWGPEYQPSWARGIVWDCTCPTDCVPMLPSSAARPVIEGARPGFFARHGAELGWPDLEMLRQREGGGIEGQSGCEMAMVIMAHHKGLQQHIGFAAKLIDRDSDAGRGWISHGFRHLPTVPARAVAKNVALQRKDKLVDGVLSEVLKPRLNTDDSLEAVDGVSGRPTDSRNGSYSRAEWPPTYLPRPSNLAEAVAILKTPASHGDSALPSSGEALPGLGDEHVFCWALDLSDAYRQLGVQVVELWEQHFIWVDGVRIDYRAEFGTAVLVGIFQRTATFVNAVGQRRIDEHDARHPYSAARRRWLARRRALLGDGERASFQLIYLDDVHGATILGASERLLPKPLEGVWDQTASTLLPRPPTQASCLDVHLAIMRATFVQAGWAIAVIKLQRGDEVECLGLRVVVESPVFPCGAIVCPEAKRLGLLREIAAQISAEGSIAFSRVEGLVGRLGNIAQVAPAANTYMQALYRLEHVRLRMGRRFLQAAGLPATGAAGARAIRRRVRSVRVNANTPATADYIRSLSWWRHALERGIQVPLAVPASFPALAAPGSAAIFTDAARESGSGGGAWMALLQSDGSLLFLWCGLPWPADIGQALRDDDKWP